MPRPSYKYLLTLIAVGVAVAVRWVLDPYFGDQFPLGTLYAAVAIAVWLGGWRAAALATVVGLLITQHLFVAPRGGLQIGGVDNLVSVLIFVTTSGIIVAFGERSNRLRRRAAQAAYRATASETLWRESEERKSAVLESALDCLITMDHTGRIVDFNPAAERTFGWTREQVVGKTVAETIIPERLRKMHWAGMHRYLQTGEHHVLDRRIEMPAVRADGTEIPIELSITAINPNNGPPFFTAFLRDISARKMAEEALRESERFRRMLVEQVKDFAIFSTDAQGIATSWNKGVERVLGYAEHEFIGIDTATMIFTPEDIRLGVPKSELSTAAERGSESNDRWMRRKDGTHFWCTGMTTALRNESGALIGYTRVMRDWTDRKLAEEAIRESRERLKVAIEAGRLGDWELDSTTGKARTSFRHDQCFGATEPFHEWSYQRFLTYVHPADRDQVNRHFQNAIASNDEWHIDFRVVWPDDSVHWIETHGRSYLDQRGQPHRMLGVVHDISERKRTEELLSIRVRQQHAIAKLGEFAMSRRELQDVFDYATTTVAQTLDVELCKLLELLPGEEELLLRSGVGWTAGLVGTATVKTTLDSQAGFTLRSNSPVIVADLHTEKRFTGPALLTQHGVVSGMSCIVRRLDGRAWGVLGTHSRRRINFTSDDVNFLVAVANILGSAIQQKHAEAELARHADSLSEAVRNVTKELEQSHERQRAAERMVALGTLAAGIGHDLGNLLLPIDARLVSLQHKTPSPEAEEDLRAIAATIEYLRNALRGLRNLAMDPANEGMSERVTDLASWWPQTVPVLNAALPRGVRLESDIPALQDDRLLVSCSPHQITQIVFNLVQNAAEALTTSTRHDRIVKVFAHRSNGHVEIGVWDNGPGMNAEAQRRCMDPFFTTKKKSLGGGMGLSLVASITERLKGEVRVESAPEKGTTFTVNLPSAHKPARQERFAQTVRSAAISVSDQRILALINWVLRAHQVAVFDIGARGENVSANLWIVDPAHHDAAKRFAEENANALAVVLDDPPPDDTPQAPAAGGRVLYTGRNPSPVRLRETLNSALDET